MKNGIVVNNLSESPYPGYTPQQIKRAYSISEVNKGDDISVAIIDFLGNPYIRQNINIFSRVFVLPAASVTEIGFNGNSQFDFSAYIEPCVDAQWVHAISPNASLVIVKASSYDEYGAINAIRTAVDFGCDIILMTFQSQRDYVFLENMDIFMSNCVFVASAGDYGAQTNFPACLPQCISVGGTELAIDKYGARTSEETVWRGTGGGICEQFDIPPYQLRMNGIYQITNGKRGVPDVSFYASPEPGYSVYHSSVYGSFGWYSAGGTSLAAAVIAGIAANILSSSKLIAQDKRKFLPMLYRLAGETSYTNSYEKYYDIVNGNNGTFSAQSGYDLCTGLGSLKNI